MFVYLIWVKILQKVDFGEIKCGRISDVISEFIMLSEILPHLTFCKILTQIKYTNIVYSLLMNFLKFQFDILFTKKVFRFKKINTINREMYVGNVGICKIE